MIAKSIWTRAIYSIGVIAIIIGALDPLEGSIVIFTGSVLLALSTFLTRDRFWKVFLSSTLMIGIGVAALFYLSSLGGFGGTSTLSWWWGTLILPYPIGWLVVVIVLIVRLFKRKATT